MKKIIAIVVIAAMIVATLAPSVFAWYYQPGEYKTTTRSEIGGNVLARDLAIVGVVAVLVWYFGKQFLSQTQKQTQEFQNQKAYYHYQKGSGIYSLAIYQQQQTPNLPTIKDVQEFAEKMSRKSGTKYFVESAW